MTNLGVKIGLMPFMPPNNPKQALHGKSHFMWTSPKFAPVCHLHIRVDFFREAPQSTSKPPQSHLEATCVCYLFLTATFCVIEGLL